MENVYALQLAAQWTGQDPADVQAAVTQLGQVTGNTWAVLSNDGQTLVLRETGRTGLVADWPMTNGQVIVIEPGSGRVSIISVPDFRARFVREVDIGTAVLTSSLTNAVWLSALAAKLGVTLPAAPAKKVTTL